MMTPTTEQKLAAAVRNLELVYAVTRRVRIINPELAPNIQLALQELEHLSSPYNINNLGKV